MKITQHNILTVACAYLLLTLMFAPASANTRHQQALRTPGSQYEVSTPARYKHSARTRYAQNEAGTSTRNKDKRKDKDAPRDSASQSSAAGNTQNNDGKKDQRTSRRPDSQREAPAVSRSDAAGIAESATGGRVLSVRENGRYWQVKVLVDDKRVRFVNVDMRTGRVR